jgi:hypothetical protein
VCRPALSHIHNRTSLTYAAARLSVLLERKIIVMKLNTCFTCGLVTVGLLTIGADSALQAVISRPGTPGGLPAVSSYPLTHTPSNQAWERNNAWAAYNANLRHIPTAQNPNRLAARQNILDQNRFIQMPQSSRRYNFQFSDNEIRSAQPALRRLGIYSGQVDGILGPDTQRAIKDYQGRNKLPVTGQPDQRLNALLGVF